VRRCTWFLTDLGIGGGERLPLTLLPEFRAFSGTLVLFKDRIDQAVPAGIPVTTLIPPGRRLRSALPQVLASALRASRGADVLVGGLEGAPLVIAALCGAWSRTPVVGVVPTHIERLQATLRMGAIEWNLLRWALRSCRAVIAASEDARESLIAVGVRPERARMIPNPVSPWAESVTRVPGTGGPTRILTVGRLETIKGMDVILDAARRMNGFAFDWQVIGPGPDQAILREQAAASGLGDRLHFVGFVPELESRFAAADLFVIASHVEGLSIAMLEAMAAGIPVVATRSGRGVEDALAGDAGVLVPVGDADALATAVTALIADPARRAELGRRGRERARDYGARAIASRYEQVLAEAADRR
jgi:glycosyltransferase involved in cell wall biosynthesis